MSQTDDDFGEFGDFQTCQVGDISVAKHQTNGDSSECETLLSNNNNNNNNNNIFERNATEFDNVLIDFDHTINQLFPLDNDAFSPTVIHSQEDSITDCPFWWNLSGNFKNFKTTSFKNSKSFDLFLGALRSANSFGDNFVKNCGTEINHDINDDYLATELDMHSLILDSSSNSLVHPGEETINADKIIQEIENIMKDDHEQDDNEKEAIPIKDVDNLVGLNASSLLNAALDEWTKYQDLFDDGDEDDEEHLNDINNQFRSLPLTINSPAPTTVPFYADNPKIRPSVTANSLESSQGSSEMSSSSYDKSQNSFVDKIQQLSIVKLNELLMEMERIIQIKSEILIHELALREDAENEKELKNIFISSLLSVQNKRRLLGSSKDKKHDKTRSKVARRKSDVGSGSNFLSSKFVPNFSTLKEKLGLIQSGTSNNPTSSSIYLTTIIPYNPDKNCLDNSTLEMLVKLLDAMNDNSSTVPQLLTDYILKVICT